MKFGLQLPIQAQSTLMAKPWEASAGPAELQRVAQACDAAGFDYVGVCDHVAIPQEFAPRMGTTWYDTVATLGWLAALTERVRLLSHVYVVPYRHPLATAKAFATLDHLSGGRAILGVGVGHVEQEFEALGIPYSRRGAITDDHLPQIRSALRDEWGAGDVGQRPRPARPEGPPIWVGGSSDAALRRAARFGDGWLPQGPPPGGTPRAVAVLREHREHAGASMDGFAVGGGLSCYLGTPAASLPEHVVAGPADRVAESVGELADEGVTHVQVRFETGSCDELVDQIGRFGESIVDRGRDG